MNYRGLFILAAAAWICAGCAPPAAAAEYPARPIRFIVPSAPGGTPDIIARAYGRKFTEKFVQSRVLDNRGGAGSTIGTELAAKAPTGTIGALACWAADSIKDLYLKRPGALV